MVQKGRIIIEKFSYFAKKNYFWCLIFKMKFTNMPLDCLLLFPSALNAFFLSSLVVPYVYKFLS